LDGATAGGGDGGAAGEFVDELVAPLVAVGPVVFVDRTALPAEPIPVLHPQPQSPRVIRKMTNKNKSDLLGLK